MMLTGMCGKIHRATVTEANINYVGSITIDKILMNAAGIHQYEQVHVLNISNGNRLMTYVIEGSPGSGEIVLNGAAARLCQVGDKVIIIAYGIFSMDEIKDYSPKIAIVNDNNQIVDI